MLRYEYILEIDFFVSYINLWKFKRKLKMIFVIFEVDIILSDVLFVLKKVREKFV